MVKSEDDEALWPPTFASDDARIKFDRLRPLARAGDADAQLQLAGLYISGQIGRPSSIFFGDKEFDQACHWLQKAAAQRHPEAMNSLGVRYNRGEGVPQDHATACRWFRIAAESGSIPALANLAMNIERGFGEPKKPAEAARLYRIAAEKGDALAKYRLGELYFRGIGVIKDNGLAVAYYRDAAANGFAPAIAMLGFMYSNGYGVKADPVEGYVLVRQAYLLDPEQNHELVFELAKDLQPEELAEAEKRLRERMSQSH